MKYHKSNRHGLNGSVIILSLFFILNLAFPKAGIKVNNVPLTVGYFISPLVIFLSLGQKRGLYPSPSALMVYLLTLPMGCFYLFCSIYNGYSTIGFFASGAVNFLYFPFLFMIGFSPDLLKNNYVLFEKLIRNCVRFAILYGIFLFFYKYITGIWFEIPYITINQGDIGQLDYKHIDRGGIFKLISTYNNGNIFGVSMLLVTPLYFTIEKHTYYKFLFIAAMILTLSRTVWVGCGVLMIFYAISEGIRLRTIFVATLFILIGIFGIKYSLDIMGKDMSFIFDESIGGRVEYIKYLYKTTILPSTPVGDFEEIVYIGALKQYGIIGFLVFLVYFFSPLVRHFMVHGRVFDNSKSSRCAQGLIVYAFICLSDGAFFLIPVILIFWLISRLMLFYFSLEKAQSQSRSTYQLSNQSWPMINFPRSP